MTDEAAGEVPTKRMMTFAEAVRPKNADEVQAEYWRRVSELSGLPLPTNSADWTVLLHRAGFSDSLIEKALTTLGFNGFEESGELPRGYFFGKDNSVPIFSARLFEGLKRYNESRPGTRDALAAMATTRHDTKADTPKKSKKIRPMNTKSVDCARRYKADKGQTPMKTIIEDYVDEVGGSFESIMRTLNDNPDQWKGDI